MAAKTTSAGTAVNRRKRKSPRSPEAIRELLLRAARQEFAQGGYGGTSTAAIAHRADVTEALLFKYFGSKSNLCRAAILEPLQQSYALFAEKFLSDIAAIEDRQQRVSLYIRSLQRWINEQSELLRVLAVMEAYGNENGVMEGGLDWLKPYFDVGGDLLATRLDREPEVDPALLSRISFAGAFACVMFQDWLFSGTRAGDEEIVTAIGDFLIGGIHANS